MELKRGKSIRRRMPAERGANTREKFLDAEGLGDVVIGAGIERNDFVPFGVAHGEHDDRSIAGTANFAAGLNAADAGKIHVEKNQIGFVLGSQFDGLFAVEASQDRVATERKRGAQNAPDLRFVVDHRMVAEFIELRPPPVATGRVNENTEPLPNWLVTRNRYHRAR